MTIFSSEAIYDAYRKAKADMFFERSLPTARKFAEYEEQLQVRLDLLASRLKGEDTNKSWFNDSCFIGDVSFIPKSLSTPTENPEEPNFFASNAVDNWNRIFQIVDAGANGLEAEFRPMANFSVDMHVVNALWLNTIGCKLDACLDKTAMGSRMRRIAGRKDYHQTVWQSFDPYFSSYKKWRDDGFAVVRREVSERRKVVAITMDFRRFFHKIDPTFLNEKKFLKHVSKKSNGACEFTAEEREFTNSLLKAFKTWGKRVPGYNSKAPLGVPVGATSSRVIANVLLLEFDELIQRDLSPLYYARYVDDIFLVIRDTGTFTCGADVLEWLKERMGKTLKTKSTRSGDCLAVTLSYGQKSEILFQTKKQRIFLIDNPDLLDAIKTKVDEVSSEYRLLPDLKKMETSAAAKVLSTSRDGTSESDSLRKADTLLLKRLGFAILLRNADALVDALPVREWRKERCELYEFALRHVFAPDKLFELFDYLPRLLGIAVSCRDWSYGHQIFDDAFRALKGIRQRAIVKLDDRAVSNEIKDMIWEKHFAHLRAAFQDSMLKSLPRIQSDQSRKRCKKLYEKIVGCSYDLTKTFEDDVLVLGEKMFCRDLARRPYKSFLLNEVGAVSDCTCKVPDNLTGDVRTRAREIIKLLEKCVRGRAEVMPILFPTRPLSASDISILHPNHGANIEFLKQTLNTVRGTLYPTDRSEAMEVLDVAPSLSSKATNRNSVLRIGRGGRREKTRIAVTSFLTELHSWCSAAGRTPDCSAARFQRLTSLCNAILTTDYKLRPHYVLFPELSIPSRWMRTIAEAFLRAGISVIAGEEYLHHGKRNKFVDSSARIFLTDNRLGYRSWCALTQQKGKPAHHERDELRRMFGLTLIPSNKSLNNKFVFSHFGFQFGVLICSELTDMKFRLKFRGELDSLFVLSWNQDLESFAALVDATALDVHCFVALVNNRAYGDSRVRMPYKDPWLRDAVRVKGGLADYFVVAELDIASLRDFQSHKEPPEGPFKPFPEGFRPSRPRRVVPGSNRK
jgi:hypothetical protein